MVLIYNEYKKYEVMDKTKMLRLKLSQNGKKWSFKSFWVLEWYELKLV